MKKIVLLLALLLTTISINAQKFSFKYEKNNFKVKKSISILAEELLIKYRSNPSVAYFKNKSILQIVAKQYLEALKSSDSLRTYLKNDSEFNTDTTNIYFEAYSKAMIKKKNEKSSFSNAFDGVFRNLYSKIEEEDINQVPQYFKKDVDSLKKRYKTYLLDIKEQDSLSISESLELCKRFGTLEVTKAIFNLSEPIIDERKNYIIQDSIIITTRDNSKLSAIIIRPKNIKEPLPVVFVFNIYAGNVDKRYALRTAKNGYIGVVVNTRGKKHSPQKLESFEHDANDAYDIIDWISKQPWCNGKVGMYGGSYLGFSQWSAVKNVHPALKTIIPQVAVGIGIDFPMHNNVFMLYMLRWIHYIENNKTTDFNEFADIIKWNTLTKKLYKKGLPFKSLDSIDGRPNETFQKWINHPSYDDFWQKMTPQKEEFSKINIPILTITGYFDGDQRGALHYFNEHYKYNPNAKHYLLIGPYDHAGAQNKPSSTVLGYTIDSVAKIDIGKLLYKWFDYTLKDGEKPKLIKNKINYQVMGANTWRHSASLTEMNNDTLTFYFDNKKPSKYYSLSKVKSKKYTFIKQEIDFKDRSDYDELIKKTIPAIIDTTFQKDNGMAFITPPFNSSFEINGSFLGQINLEINKRDVDLKITLYEVTQDNKFIRFSVYGFLGRASYAKNKSKRQLLTPYKKEEIPFSNSYFTSKLIAKGSRLLAVLSVNKDPNYQINYGTGKDVSDETIKDAEIPLQIKWFSDSFIKVPVKKL